MIIGIQQLAICGTATPEAGLTSYDMSDDPIQLGDCDLLIDRGQQIKGKGQ